MHVNILNESSLVCWGASEVLDAVIVGYCICIGYKSIMALVGGWVEAGSVLSSLVSRIGLRSSFSAFLSFFSNQQVKGPKVRKVVVRTYVRKHYVDTILYSYSRYVPTLLH